jgi:hypothetical protein
VGDGVQNQALIAQAEALRADARLGKSPALYRLLDYLVQASLENRSPKEIEVAAAVFGRGDNFDTMHDASVRVYAHRLRKRIDDFYAGEGVSEPWRLTFPKGEYRLSVEPFVAAEQVLGHGNPGAPSRAKRHWWIGGGALIVILAMLALSLWLALRPDKLDRDVAAVRATPLWTGLLSQNRPIVIALGDYYIFGEADRHGTIKRLVREFAINSRYDLDDDVMNHPELKDRYVDLDLHYYPIGVATALRDVLQIVQTPDRRDRPIRIIPASTLNPEILRISNVVYIGYVSALGVLRNPVFNGSHYAIGDSYDELIDKRSGREFTATTGKPTNSPQRDYGYVSAFRGPSGNSFIVIAGTRDAAVMQAADFVSHPLGAKKIAVRGGADALEAMLVVDTVGDQYLAGRLLDVAPLDAAHIWRDGAPQVFPDDANTQPVR